MVHSSRKRLALEILLVIFSLKLDKVVLILFGLFKYSLGEKIDVKDFDYVEMQAVFAGFALSAYLFIMHIRYFSPFFNGDNLGQSDRNQIYTEIISTFVLSAVTSCIVIFSQLVGLNETDITRINSLVFFVFIYLFIVLVPLLFRGKYVLEILSKNYASLVYSTFMIVFLWVVGWVTRRQFELGGKVLIYETEEFLVLSFLWAFYIRRWLKEGRSLLTIVWVTAYIFVGFLAGSYYGMSLFDRAITVADPSTFLPLYWGAYGAVPAVLIAIYTVNRNTSYRDILYCGITMFFLMISLTILLHSQYSHTRLDKSITISGGIVEGVVTGLLSLLVLLTVIGFDNVYKKLVTNSNIIP